MFSRNFEILLVQQTKDTALPLEQFIDRTSRLLDAYSTRIGELVRRLNESTTRPVTAPIVRPQSPAAVFDNGSLRKHIELLTRLSKVQRA